MVRDQSRHCGVSAAGTDPYELRRRIGLIAAGQRRRVLHRIRSARSVDAMVLLGIKLSVAMRPQGGESEECSAWCEFSVCASEVRGASQSSPFS